MKTVIRPEAEMKDSGIDWIGSMPINWKVVRIKNLPNYQENSFVDGDWIESSYITDTGIRYYTTGNIGDGKFKEQGNGYISESTFDELKCKYVFPGDLVFSRLNDPYGRSCIIPATEPKCIVAVDNVILRTNEDKRYICYITQCDGYHSEVGELARGTAMKRVSRTNLGTIRIPLPEKIEQQAIADYLDETCSKIDEIIAEAKASIDEYNELRQSIIHEVLTKGLDKNVDMKDSGVKWIGKIPSHWIVGKVKYGVTKVGSGKTPKGGAEVYTTSGVVFLRSQNIYDDGLRLDTPYYISEEIDEEMKNTRVQKYDVLLNITGGSIGRCCIFDGSIPNANVNQHVCIIRVNTVVFLPEYMHLFWISPIGQFSIKSYQTGGNREGMSAEAIKNTPILIIPITEQRKIISFIKPKVEKIDSLITEKQSLIADLESYKKSLIYEVVTGKRKVV